MRVAPHADGPRLSLGTPALHVEANPVFVAVSVRRHFDVHCDMHFAANWVAEINLVFFTLSEIARGLIWSKYPKKLMNLRIIPILFRISQIQHRWQRNARWAVRNWIEDEKLPSHLGNGGIISYWRNGASRGKIMLPHCNMFPWRNNSAFEREMQVVDHWKSEDYSQCIRKMGAWIDEQAT